MLCSGRIAMNKGPGGADRQTPDQRRRDDLWHSAMNLMA
jgi:hypothetical protein